MSIANPNVEGGKPFADHFQEGETFHLVGIRTQDVRNTEFGSGTMVILQIETNGDKENYTIWGQYLVEQANSVETGDLPGDYKIVRKVVDNYSKRPTKALEPVF